MLTIAHKSGTAGEGKNTNEVSAGQIITGAVRSSSAIAAGLADLRTVICTKKHFGHDVNGVARACAEREPIDDVALAINALRTGRARLEPPLGTGVKLKFAPIAAPKTSAAKDSQGGAFKKTEKQK